MQDLLEPAEAAAIALAPGLTLLRRYLDDTAQRALASEIEKLVSLAPWFLPRMPRSGRPFSVKMTNCGRLGWVSDRDGGYRYQATHPVTGEAAFGPRLRARYLARRGFTPAFARSLPRQFLRFVGEDGLAPGSRRSGARRAGGVDFARR
jgi:alkylated DNA repair dioxygenase AlkB